MPKRPRSSSSPDQTERLTPQQIKDSIGRELRELFFPAERSSEMTEGSWLTEYYQRRAEKWAIYRHIRNFATGKRYGYINDDYLLHGLEDHALLNAGAPQFATFKQIKALGGKVRKGSRAVARVCYTTWLPDKSDPTGQEMYMVTRWASVFHHTQCEGLPEEVTQRLEKARFSYFARHLPTPVQLEPDTTGVPTLQEFALRCLAAQPKATGPTVDFCRTTTRTWWPALEDHRAAGVLDRLVAERTVGETFDAHEADPHRVNRLKHWDYDPDAKTLRGPPRQAYADMRLYYLDAFRTIARAQSGYRTKKKTLRSLLTAECRVYAYMQEAALPYKSRDAPKRLNKASATFRGKLCTRDLGHAVVSATQALAPLTA